MALDIMERPAPGPIPYEDGVDPTSAEYEPYPFRRVVAGCVGRIWLWFLVGCLAVTVLPVLIGWSSYLVETGSMKPSIKPGDVVITSPRPSIDQVGGRVITFNSPTVPDQVVTHRVVEISDDGQMRTKGDANATADSATITINDVRGMGRLLVRFVGLPKVWAQQGSWLPLAGFALVVLLAGLAVRYDRESLEDETLDDADPGVEPDPDAGGARPGGLDAGALAASSVLVAARRPKAPFVFVLLVFLYAAALVVPSVLALVNASTASAANNWSVPQYDYTSTLVGYTPWVYYKLDDTTGTNVVDTSGTGRTGTYTGGYTKGIVGALETDTPNTAVTATSATSCINLPNAAKITPAPTVYSSTTWIKVPAGYNQGGKILGFESARTGLSDSTNGGQYDRHVYMDGSGRIRFGVWLGYSFTLKSPAAYNDGGWHMVATTMGPGGMSLYVDGILQASSTNTASEVFTNGGWWRFGCGNLSGWSATTGTGEAWTGPNPPLAQQNYPLLGSMDEAAIWQGRVLTASEISFLYFTR